MTDLMGSSVKDKIDELTLELRLHRYRYYRYSNPVITDSEYDRLERKLQALEEEYPQFRQVNSPTATVGSDLFDKELEELLTQGSNGGKL